MSNPLRSRPPSRGRSASRRAALLGLATTAALPLLPARLAAASSHLLETFSLPRDIVAETPDGSLRAAGFALPEAAEVLLMATKAHSLPAGYEPADLAPAPRLGVPSPSGQWLRAILADDLQALVAAAAAQDYALWVGSGYRSYGHQAAIFAAQVARRGGDEEGANRYSARPGHSQHQLGTTIDFNDTFRAFGASPAGAWLSAHAHEHGFVFPYTERSQDRTGYVSEPWHARWVGRTLSGAMNAAGYLTAEDWTADDYIAAVRVAAGLPVAVA